MTTSTTTSYDDVPYECKPLYSAHPNSLAVAARLRGLTAPPPSNCRVLELGCATGGNLIPMAYGLPTSRFVGVDLSQRQIAEGHRLCQQLELPNVELHAVSIADIDKSWGTFDYIICHGVYSWVPPAIQERILWICRNLMTPQGVAFISYNTYPGWHLRRVVRDLMKYHSARFEDPESKVYQARTILNFMAAASASAKSPLSRVFAEESGNLQKAADYYLYHEHLEDANQPFYFHEFVAQARAAGLDYLGEAWIHSRMDDLPPKVQEALETISSDLIDLEQFLDYIRARTFRRTLLCHGEVKVEHTPEPVAIEPFFIAPLARPKSAQPDIASDKPEDFELVDGSTATTNSAILKAALVRLSERFPGSVSFDDLFDEASRSLNLTKEGRDKARPQLAALLMSGYVTHLVAVQCEPFVFTTQISQRPRASRLARRLAVEHPRLPTLRHEMKEFSPAERLVLRLVDGTRTAEQIAADVANSKDESTHPELVGDCQACVASCLERFARTPLLET
jgi:methyltransferase-like protein